MLNKVLLRVTGTTITVGGGIGTYLYLRKSEELPPMEKSSVKDLLVIEKYTPLTDNSNSHWDTILQSYKTIVQSKKDLGFANFDGKASDAVNTLKTKCSEALNSKDEQLLNKAKKWCVTPLSASALLTARKIKVLKTEGTEDEGENAKWKERIAEFKVAKKTNTGLVALITIKEQTTPDTEDINAIKGKCKTFGDTLNHAAEFEENLKHLETWCIDK